MKIVKLKVNKNLMGVKFPQYINLNDLLKNESKFAHESNKINGLLRVIVLLVSIVMLLTSCKVNPPIKFDTKSIVNVNEQQFPLQNETLENMDEVARSKKQVLFLDSKTTNFAVKDIETGNIWRSTPSEIDNENIIDDLKNEMKSLFRIYYTEKDTEYFMDSYTESVQKEQFKISPIKNGVRIDFVLGRGASETLLPVAITEKRMNDVILSKIEDERTKRKAIILYTLYSKETAPSAEDYESWVKEFPILARENIYVLHEGFDREIIQTEDIFKSVGYTPEMTKFDNKETKQSDVERSDPFFKIPLEITLSEDCLSVKIPAKDILYNDKGYYLNEISMLEYFSAGVKGTDGYVFTPDGSGSIIKFDKEKIGAVQGSKTALYGEDSALEFDKNANVVQPMRMPVFGIKNQKSAIFAIIERGDSIAKISTVGANVSQPYNTAFPSFIIKAKEVINFSDWGGAGFKWTVIDKNIYKDDIVVKYYFLTGVKANYGGMAGIYREYLKNNNIIKKRTVDDIPFYLEVFGCFDRKDKIAGIPMNIKTSLTTFDKAKLMLKELQAGNVDNIKLKYSGWANGGLRSSSSEDIKIEKALGGKSGFLEFADFAKKSKVEVFPDIDFNFIGKDTILDDFIPNKDALRRLNNKFGGSVKANLSDSNIDFSTYRTAISPDASYRHAVKFNNKFSKYDIEGLSVTSIGSVLNSNFSKKKYYNRESSKNVSEEILNFLSKSDTLMIDGGNAYTYKYAKHIIKMPMTSSDYQFSDGSIPFMQMVLHGYIDYAGEPVNLSGEYETEILLAAANGSGLYFVLNYENTKYLKNTEFSTKFSTDYTSWIKDAIKQYQKLNTVLKEVSNSEMIDYINLAENVYESVYANGKSVITNFSENAFVKGSVTIKARDFILKNDN